MGRWHGPCSEADLRKFYSKGELNPSSQVLGPLFTSDLKAVEGMDATRIAEKSPGLPAELSALPELESNLQPGKRHPSRKAYVDPSVKGVLICLLLDYTQEIMMVFSSLRAGSVQATVIAYGNCRITHGFSHKRFIALLRR